MNSKRKYTHLFFDLDNTLWDFKNNSYYALKEAFTYFNLHLSKVEFEFFFQTYSANNRLLWDEYRKGNVVKKELVRLRFQKTFDELELKGIDPLVMNAFYLDEMPKQKRLVPGAESILNYLKTRGFKLFIITNGFTRVQHKKLESAGIKKYFSKVFISEEISAPKPAPEIFEHALKSANARKTRSLMIGDDFNADILGALNFGIDAVYLDSKENGNPVHENTNFLSGKLFFRIDALSELSNIV